MSKTTDNLKEAFAGESQANRKYLAFARKADEEGCPRLPSCFVPPPRRRPSTPTRTCAF
jgi:rubrerythrin